MNRLGILTFHDSDNYGSVLQAYALSHYLLSKGIDCEIIDYRKKEVKEIYQIFKKIHSRHELLMNIYTVFHLKKIQKRKKKFEIFRKTHLPLSNEFYCEKKIF
jgi:ABC-type microcin C transport system permease subunit YejB